METYKLGEMERKFADIIWANAPITTRMLVELAEKEFGWKRTTTYTMLKRLCDRGIFEIRGGSVKVLITKDDFNFRQSENFIQETYGGSLPMFLTRFSKGKGLNKQEIDQLQRLIDSYREGSDD